MASSELGSRSAGVASGWAARVASPRVLVLAAAVLLLITIPFTHSGNDGQPNYFWSSLAVLLALWQIWRRQRLIWVLAIAVTSANLVFYGLSVAGAVSTGLPGRWIPIAADLLVLAILLSPPIRRWVATRPAPAP